MAVNFNINPSLSINEIYTDNVALADSDNKNSDFISVITPSLALITEGRYATTAIYYNLQSIYYADSDKEKYVHTLDVSNNSELFKDLLFLDLGVRKSQQNVSNAGRRTSDNLPLSSDLEDVTSYNFSPYWRQRISDITDLEVRYFYNKIESDTLTNQSRGIDVYAESGTLFSNLLWEINYNYEDISGTAQGLQFNTVTGSFRYLMNNRFAVLADIGYDDNDFAAARNDVTGELWNLGVEWKPSRRTSVKLKYGERYFGTNVLAEASHQTKRSRILLTYSETPDTARTRLLEQQAFGLLDLFGTEIPEPALNQPVSLDVTGSDQFVEVFIKKSLRFAYNLNFRKNYFDLALERQEREYQVSAADETVDSVTFSWMWDISRSMNSEFNLNWSNSDFSSNTKDKYFTAQFNLSRSISEFLNINLGMNYTELNSNIAGRDYDEFRVYAGINKSF